MRNADTVRGLNRGIGRPLHRSTSLESGVMRKYHAPFGGRPTEKGSIQSTSLAAHPTQSPGAEAAHSSVAHLESDAIASHGFDFCSWYTLRDGRCPARASNGL